MDPACRAGVARHLRIRAGAKVIVDIDAGRLDRCDERQHLRRRVGHFSPMQRQQQFGVQHPDAPLAGEQVSLIVVDGGSTDFPLRGGSMQERCQGGAIAGNHAIFGGRRQKADDGAAVVVQRPVEGDRAAIQHQRRDERGQQCGGQQRSQQEPSVQRQATGAVHGCLRLSMLSARCSSSASGYISERATWRLTATLK